MSEQYLGHVRFDTHQLVVKWYDGYQDMIVMPGEGSRLDIADVNLDQQGRKRLLDAIKISTNLVDGMISILIKKLIS